MKEMINLNVGMRIFSSPPSASQSTSEVENIYNLQRFLNCQEFLEKSSKESCRDYFHPVGE